MDQITLIKATQKLHSFCKKENYKGYSLYDSHNSPFPFKKLGRRLSFIINQVNKRSPINFRPLLGIKKGINPKGYGLFLHSYSLLADSDLLDKKITENKAHFFFNWLKENPSDGYSGHCWGYNYYWPAKNGDDVPENTPSVVVTGFIARAMLAYFEQFKNEEVKSILKSAVKFVLNDIHLYKSESEGFCFSYTPVAKDLTVNANLLAAETLAYSDYVNKTDNYNDLIRNVLKFTFNNQNNDGSWYYSFDYKTREPKKQIDFHQGYVLESLYRIKKYSNVSYNDKWISQIEKGLKFYYKNQFDSNGMAYWRLPKKWPIDIHNQSQGIITFSIFSSYNDDYTKLSQKIIDWTIKNMQGNKGNFFYQKWPIITSRVNYLRWNQGWMLLALSTYLKNNYK